MLPRRGQASNRRPRFSSTRSPRSPSKTISAPTWRSCAARSAATWILSSELRRALRKLKPERLDGPLLVRPDDELPSVQQNLRPGPELLLDSVVYIDALQD